MKFFLLFFISFNCFSSDYTKQFTPFLPQKVQQPIIEAIQILNYPKILKDRPIRFISAQSVKGVNELKSKNFSPIYAHNDLYFRQYKNFDIWILNQSQYPRKSEKHNLLSIFIDKGKKPFTAYYLEFKYPIIGKVPVPTDYHVKCFSCHSNGPLFNYPQRVNGFVLNKKDQVELKKLNSIIQNYGSIKSFNSNNKQNKKYHDHFSSIDPVEMEPFEHHACVGCHNADSDIRNVLYRQSKSVIRTYIVTNKDEDGYMHRIGNLWPAQLAEYKSNPSYKFALMPLGEKKLHENDINCIIAWTEHKGKGKFNKKGCSEKGEWIRKSQRNIYKTFSSGKGLRVKVDTILRPFYIDDMMTSGQITCDNQNKNCTGSFIGSLIDLKTGISLRDQHLKEKYINTDKYFSTHIQLHPFKFRLDKTMYLKGDINFVGEKKNYNFSVRCGEKGGFIDCQIKSLAISISSHGIQSPSFLSVAVKDLVKIEGTIRLKEGKN